MTRLALLGLAFIIQFPLIGQKRAVKKTLDQLSEKYDSYQSFDILFDLQVIYPERPVQNQKAQLIQQGTQFIFTSDDQDIYGDGENVYLYLKDRNEVQINDFDNEDELGLMTPKDLLKQYKTDQFEYEMEDQTDQEMIIIFKPLQRESEYSKYRVTINKQTKDFQSIDAFGKDGSKILVSIANASYNKSYPKDYFLFDQSLYPNIRVEDLRID